MRFAFSRTELVHLGSGILALTLAFNFLLDDDPGLQRFVPDGINLIAALLAVATGFVLHELAHKAVAQSYGHWAEFRARHGGLLLTVLVAALVRFLFAAPGAVVIQGRVTPRENGLISLVGPGVNLVVGLATWLAVLLPDPDLNVAASGGLVLHVVAFVNALLAVFNLIPVGNLDGRKVVRWNGAVYAAALAAAVALLAAIVVTLGFVGGQ